MKRKAKKQVKKKAKLRPRGTPAQGRGVGISNKLKTRMVKAQVEAMERGLTPIIVKFKRQPTWSVDLSTRKGVMQFNELLADLAFKRLIDGRTLGSFAHLVAEHHRVMVGQQIEDRLDELEESAERTRKALSDRIGLEGHSGTEQPIITTKTSRPRTVDQREQDS